MGLFGQGAGRPDEGQQMQVRPNGRPFPAGSRTKRGRIATAAAIAASVLCMLFLSGCLSQGNGLPALGEEQVQPPAVAESGKLRVGVNAGNSPMAGNSGGRLIGIDVDVAAALSSELGLELELVDVGSEGEAAIEDDEVDVVLGVESDSDYDGFWMSKEYIQTGIVLFKEADSNAEVPSAESSPAIAAQISSKSAWAVTNIFGDDSLDAVTDLTSAFEDLGTGKVTYVASDAVIGLYAANRQGVDVEICALLEPATGYCAMVLEENDDLHDAVRNALTTLSDNGTIDIIEKKWLGQVVNLKGITRIEATVDRSNTASNTDTSDTTDNSEDSDTEGNADTDNASETNESGTTTSGTSNPAVAVVIDDDEIEEAEEDF